MPVKWPDAVTPLREQASLDSLVRIGCHLVAESANESHKGPYNLSVERALDLRFS
jgi:hypothetical protein